MKLMYSAGNYIQYLIITYNEKEHILCMCVCMCVCMCACVCVYVCVCVCVWLNHCALHLKLTQCCESTMAVNFQLLGVTLFGVKHYYRNVIFFS